MNFENLQHISTRSEDLVFAYELLMFFSKLIEIEKNKLFNSLTYPFVYQAAWKSHYVLASSDYHDYSDFQQP